MMARFCFAIPIAASPWGADFSAPSQRVRSRASALRSTDSSY